MNTERFTPQGAMHFDRVQADRKNRLDRLALGVKAERLAQEAGRGANFPVTRESALMVLVTNPHIVDCWSCGAKRVRQHLPDCQAIRNAPLMANPCNRHAHDENDNCLEGDEWEVVQGGRV